MDGVCRKRMRGRPERCCCCCCCSGRRTGTEEQQLLVTDNLGFSFTSKALEILKKLPSQLDLTGNILSGFLSYFRFVKLEAKVAQLAEKGCSTRGYDISGGERVYGWMVMMMMNDSTSIGVTSISCYYCYYYYYYYYYYYVIHSFLTLRQSDS
jgi:hypothetical protein